MKRTKTRTIALVSTALLLSAFACVWAEDQIIININIAVAPNVLNLQNNGQVVTVHTDLPYSSVAGATVTLNGVEISGWKSDNQGNFVAKFVMQDIKNLPLNIGELNTLTLTGTGETVSGGSFSFTGAADILVVNNIPRK